MIFSPYNKIKQQTNSPLLLYGLEYLDLFIHLKENEIIKQIFVFTNNDSNENKAFCFSVCR